MRTILVTGANRGLGLEFVRQLAMSPQSTHIFAACRNPEKAEDLRALCTENSKVHIVALDVTNDDSIKQAVQAVEKQLSNADMGLNLLINNAGILRTGESKYATGISRASLLEHFNVNTAGCVMVTQAFGALLKTAAGVPEQHNAAVVNISSTIGSISKMASFTLQMSGYAYPLAKAALNMSTKCLSIDLGGSGVTVVSMCPGWVSTDMGGPRAQLTPQQSVSAMLETIGKLEISHQGMFVDRNGKNIDY